MPLTQHTYIQNRADFFRVLEEAKLLGERLQGGTPKPPLDSIGRQLDAIKSWTANGRTPTREERRSINMGLLVVRELEPAANDALDEYMKRIYELNMYFKLWWDDPEWVNMDEDDPRPDFPDDDLSPDFRDDDDD